MQKSGFVWSLSMKDFSSSRFLGISYLTPPSPRHVTVQTLFVLSRCRGSRTTLYASRAPRDSEICSDGRARAQLGTRAVTRAYLHCEAGRLWLWVECHRQDCEMAFGVAADGGPRWLVKFAEYVLHHDWEASNFSFASWLVISPSLEF